MTVISELIRFILPRSNATASAAFGDLRRTVGTAAKVQTQYFGYVIPNEGFPSFREQNQVCWFIGKLSPSEMQTQTLMMTCDRVAKRSICFV
jgi:hypothetical protein